MTLKCQKDASRILNNESSTYYKVSIDTRAAEWHKSQGIQLLKLCRS